MRTIGNFCPLSGRPSSTLNAFPAPPLMDEVAETYGSVPTAAAAAQAALDGVEHERLHVIPTPGIGGAVRARVDALLADLPDP